MNSHRLQYYMHDETDGLRFQLTGSLSGAGSERVYQAWHPSPSIIGNYPLLVHITFLIDVDEHGFAALDVRHRSGARIIAASPGSQALSEAVPGEPLPVALPEQRWIQRLREFDLRCTTVVIRPRLAGRLAILREYRHQNAADDSNQLHPRSS